MKIKVGTQIEKEIYQSLKVVAAQERKPVGDVIQEAVADYLKRAQAPRQQKSGLARLLEREQFRISDEAHREIMEADFYDQ